MGKDARLLICGYLEGLTTIDGKGLLKMLQDVKSAGGLLELIFAEGNVDIWHILIMHEENCKRRQRDLARWEHWKTYFMERR